MHFAKSKVQAFWIQIKNSAAQKNFVVGFMFLLQKNSRAMLIPCLLHVHFSVGDVGILWRVKKMNGLKGSFGRRPSLSMEHGEYSVLFSVFSNFFSSFESSKIWIGKWRGNCFCFPNFLSRMLFGYVRPMAWNWSDIHHSLCSITEFNLLYSSSNSDFLWRVSFVVQKMFSFISKVILHFLFWKHWIRNYNWHSNHNERIV